MKSRIVNKILSSFLLLCICSCQWFNGQEELPPSLELDGNHLTREEIVDLLPEDISAEDSVLIVNRYVENWILDTALREKALENIPDDRQKQLDKLVKRYKDELYAQEYLKELTKQNLDTAISSSSIINYYEQKKEQFKLNEDLVKLLYVKVDPLYSDFSKIIKYVKKQDSESKLKLDSLKLGFKAYILNDSLWYTKSRVFEKTVFLNALNEDSYLKKGKFTQFEDSTGVHLIKVIDILNRGEVAPLSYIEPSIRQILLNRKKLEYKKKLKTDLLQNSQSRLKNNLNE